MKDRIKYTFARTGKGKPNSGKPDPRLAALVRFLARRAAERDYERLLAELDAAKET